MKEQIERFLKENAIKAITEMIPMTISQEHPFGTCWETRLMYNGKERAFITYGGEIALEDEWTPAVQLWKIHDDIQSYEETFERFVAENQDYVYWFRRDGTKRIWHERTVYWDTLLSLLGEDLFWQFYRLS